jgi:hypothetical protein
MTWSGAGVGRCLLTGWLVLAAALRGAVTWLILAAFYLAVVTPLALVFRALRRDPLALGRRARRPSYWVPKPGVAGPESYFRPC